MSLRTGWDSTILIMKNHGHARPWENDPKFENIWENLPSQKKPSSSFFICISLPTENKIYDVCEFSEMLLKCVILAK